MKLKPNEIVHFEQKLSILESKNASFLSYLVVIFSLLLVLGWTVNYFLWGVLSIEVPFFSLLLSFAIAAAFQESWTIRMFTAKDGDDYMELVRHINVFIPTKWARLVRCGPVIDSSLQLYYKKGKYHLRHCISGDVHDVFIVKSWHRNTFKHYCKDAIMAACRLDKLMSLKHYEDLEKVLDRPSSQSQAKEHRNNVKNKLNSRTAA